MAYQKHELFKTLQIGHSGIEEIEIYFYGNEINLDVEAEHNINIYLKPDELKQFIEILQEASKKIALNNLMQLGD